MDSKELRSRVLTYPSRLLSRPSDGDGVCHAQTEPSQLTATAALEMLQESPSDAELISRVPETELLSIEDENYSAVEFGAIAHSHRRCL